MRLVGTKQATHAPTHNCTTLAANRSRTLTSSSTLCTQYLFPTSTLGLNHNSNSTLSPAARTCWLPSLPPLRVYSTPCSLLLILCRPPLSAKLLEVLF